MHVIVLPICKYFILRHKKYFESLQHLGTEVAETFTQVRVTLHKYKITQEKVKSSDPRYYSRKIKKVLNENIT